MVNDRQTIKNESILRPLKQTVYVKSIIFVLPTNKMVIKTTLFLILMYPHCEASLSCYLSLWIPPSTLIYWSVLKCFTVHLRFQFGSSSFIEPLEAFQTPQQWSAAWLFLNPPSDQVQVACLAQVYQHQGLLETSGAAWEQKNSIKIQFIWWWTFGRETKEEWLWEKNSHSKLLSRINAQFFLNVKQENKSS